MSAQAELSRPHVGVLALQGGVEEHGDALEAVGAEAVEVRTSHELSGVDGIVIPGGESTTVGKLVRRDGLLDDLREAVAAGLPALGTCAGLIALAREIEGGERPAVGGLDVRVRRNAYGRQGRSFETDLAVPSLGPEPMPRVFIRAPQITSVGDGVDVLARHDGVPVAVLQGHLWATAFHPELTDDRRLHDAFVAAVRRACAREASAETPAKGGRGVRA